MLNILQNGQTRDIGLISPAADCARGSEELGQARPPHFQSRSRSRGVSVANVLHIGDDSALDAVGALQAGMHAAWLNREGKDWPHEQPEPHHQSLRHVKSLAELCELLKMADSAMYLIAA